jgi:hypothetical protein
MTRGAARANVPRMLQVSETSGGLLLAVPMWIGIATVLLGLGLVAAAVLAATPKGREFAARIPFLARVPMAPWVPLAKLRWGTLGIAAAGGLFLVHAGVGFLFTSTVFEPRGVIVNGVLGEEDRLAWSQVRRQEIEELALGRGRASYLVLYTRSGEYLPVGISGLPAEDSVRLQKFVSERIKR